MKTLGRAIAVTAAGLLLIAPAAAAQETEIGGEVPSFLSLSFDEPSGFAKFPARPGTHELPIRVCVTATDGPTHLLVADGDLASGRGLGRMASRSGPLAQPLEARVGSGVFQGLDTPIDPLLTEWTDPVANAPATVTLRQRIEPGERPRGTYGKTILITLSSDAP